MKSGGFQPFGKPNDWERRDDASHVGHNRWDGYHSRRATQPWSVSRPKDVAPGWWRSYLGSDRGPETGLSLSLIPSRPGRGYGAGPAAVKGGSTGLVIASTTTTTPVRRSPVAGGS